MTLIEAKEHFGTYTRLAKSLGVSKGAITLWKNEGRIPESRQLALHKITKGQLKADSDILAKYREILRAA